MAKGLPFNANVSTACSDICYHVDANPDEKGLVTSIRSDGEQKGFITAKQAMVLGAIYKKVIHSGEYVHHDWWEDSVLMEYYINQNNWPTDLTEAKAFAVDCVNSWKFKTKIPAAIRTIENTTSMKKLQQFVINALLSGSGLGTIK